MFVDLPFEVVGEILRGWLELKSLVRVDSAQAENAPNTGQDFSSSLQELRLEGVEALEISHFEEVKLPQLDILSLQRSDLDDELLSAILCTTEKLHHLNIGKCINITDEGIIAVAKHCPHLRSIGLSKLQISDGALSELTELSSHIDNVQIYGNELITDQGVLSIAKNLPQLRNIGLSFCDALTDRSLEHLMKFSAATLETLCVFGFQQVRVDVLVSLLQQCPQLRTLGLDIDFNSYCADIVPHMHNLRNLLVYCIVQDDSLCMIAQHCKQLEKLGIPCTIKVDPDLAAAAHQSANDAGVGDVRVMHCAEEDAADGDTIYSEKAVLAMMDGLVNLRQLWAPDVSGDALNDMVVQCLWKRLRPQIQFEQSEKKFYLDVMGEITVCSSF
eukprot:gene12308-14250_t